MWVCYFVDGADNWPEAVVHGSGKAVFQRSLMALPEPVLHSLPPTTRFLSLVSFNLSHFARQLRRAKMVDSEKNLMNSSANLNVDGV
jgi:hypothetical protein